MKLVVGSLSKKWNIGNLKFAVFKLFIYGNLLCIQQKEKCPFVYVLLSFMQMMSYKKMDVPNMCNTLKCDLAAMFWQSEGDVRFLYPISTRWSRRWDPAI